MKLSLHPESIPPPPSVAPPSSHVGTTTDSLSVTIRDRNLLRSDLARISLPTGCEQRSHMATVLSSSRAIAAAGQRPGAALATPMAVRSGRQQPARREARRALLTGEASVAAPPVLGPAWQYHDIQSGWVTTSLVDVWLHSLHRRCHRCQGGPRFAADTSTETPLSRVASACSDCCCRCAGVWRPRATAAARGRLPLRGAQHTAEVAARSLLSLPCHALMMARADRLLMLSG